MLSFSVYCTQSRSQPRVSYFENMQAMTCKLYMAPNMHFKHCAMCHSVHCSNTNKLWPLKYTKPVSGKSKVGRPGSMCGVCVGVSRTKISVPESGCGETTTFLFLFVFDLYMQPCSQTSKFENFDLSCLGVWAFQNDYHFVFFLFYFYFFILFFIFYFLCWKHHSVKEAEQSREEQNMATNNNKRQIKQSKNNKN